ncbi:hypothetical protein [Saccharopolyspora taberi]|uniref:Uncharacterized protein n=1 Tax=Saccharopolyspora taberi TaxID=60895 RepID=A0ABN3VCE9_9PSEU
MDAHSDARPGVWSGTVAHDDQVDLFTLAFAVDGTVSLVTPISTGRGSWEAVDSTRFIYRLEEIFKPGSGMDGSVSIEVAAEVSGDTYTGSGTAHLVLRTPQGEIRRSTTCSLEGKRETHVVPDVLEDRYGGVVGH